MIPNPPIGALLCGDCQHELRILSANRVICPICRTRWNMINGKWHFIPINDKPLKKLNEYD